MQVTMVTHWSRNGVFVFPDEVPDDFYYYHTIFGLAISIEGHCALEIDATDALGVLPLIERGSDILYVNLAPQTADVVLALNDKTKVIVWESDPPGGLDYCSGEEMDKMWRAFDRANAILSPQTELIKAMWPLKILDLPMGINTKHVEKYSEGLSKYPEPTACLCHAVRSYVGAIETIEVLKGQDYKVVINVKEGLDFIKERYKDDPMVIVQNETHASEHMKIIAQSHLIAQLCKLSACGSGISKAAALGIPSIAGPHYYQCMLYPSLVCYSMADARQVIQRRELMNSAAEQAKEKAYSISLSNENYRKLVVEKFEEVLAS